MYTKIIRIPTTAVSRKADINSRTTIWPAKRDLYQRIMLYQSVIDQVSGLYALFGVTPYCLRGNCLPISYGWAVILQDMRYPVHRYLTRLNERVPGSLTKRFNWVHAFLADNHLDTEIIIDPTYKQVFRDAHELSALPNIFIGTQKDLLRLYRTYQDRLQLGSRDGYGITYDPETFYELVYARGSRSDQGERIDLRCNWLMGCPIPPDADNAISKVASLFFHN